MSKVYVVNRPVENKFGWVPDLTDATRYGTLEIIFEPNEKPQFLPGPCLLKARRVLKNFSPEDYLLWAGGGDPIAVMISAIVASEKSPLLRVLRWERNVEQGSRDRRQGWYMPITLEHNKGKLSYD